MFKKSIVISCLALCSLGLLGERVGQKTGDNAQSVLEKVLQK